MTVMIAGCAQRPVLRAGAGDRTSAAPSAIPAEISKALATQYRIAPMDLLLINVHMEPDLSRTIRVSPGGTINYPLIGETDVAGLSPFELEKRLTEELSRFVVNPNVSVDLKELHSRRVAILGEVNKPGVYDIPADKSLSVVEAIATAGGFTKFASANGTRVVRTVDGVQRTTKVPVNEVTKGNSEEDLILHPDDVVFVPQTMF